MDWFTDVDTSMPSPRSVTFHIWTVYSEFVTWAEVVTEWLKIKKDRGKLKTFVNTTLGEAWEEDQGEQLEWQQLHARREIYPQVPAKAVALFGGIDTQDDRYEGRVWAFGAGEEAWLVHKFVLQGDPGSIELRAKVGIEIHKTFTRADGTVMGVERWCWDQGGHYCDEVREECIKHGTQWVIPVFGASTYGKPIATWPRKKTKVKGGRAYLVEVGTDNAKELIYGRLKMQPDGSGAPVPGCIHLPANEMICGEDELRQLTAERRKWVIVKHQRVQRWDAGGRRNEALDCLVYALAALRITQQRFGMNLDLLAQQLPSGTWAVPMSHEQKSKPATVAALTPATVSVPEVEPEHSPDQPAESGGWLNTGQGAWL
ncbi:Phage terminase large subunit [compost metagenome]